MDYALVAGVHLDTIDRQLAQQKPKHDTINAYMDTLKTRGGKGKFTEISNTEAMCIGYDEWPEWVDMHVEDVMGGKPNSAEAEVFKRKMISTLRGMKLTQGSMKDAEIVDLDFQDGAAQFIFGYNACCSNNKAEREMHVLVSGFGKKWDMPEGEKLDRSWWNEHNDDIKGFLKYGALKQARDMLAHSAPASAIEAEVEVEVDGPPDFAYVASMHMGAIEKALEERKPEHDIIEDYLGTLQTKGGRGKFTEICKVTAIQIDYEDWTEWCEMRADDIVAGRPTSEDSEVFKLGMIKSMKSMRIGKGSMKSGENWGDLDYDGAAQSIIGWSAVCSNNKAEKKMNVLVSSFGKKWEMPEGEKLDKAWFDEHSRCFSAYLRYGSLKQVKYVLQDHA